MNPTDSLKEFHDNPVLHLPLSLTHSFGYSIDAPVSDKQRIIRAVLEDLKQKGFGGIVTNVCQTE